MKSLIFFLTICTFTLFANCLFCQTTDIVLIPEFTHSGVKEMITLQLINNSEKDFLTRNPLTFRNTFRIISPSGKNKRIMDISLAHAENPIIRIAPKGSITWEVDIEKILDLGRFEEKGAYKIIWELKKLSDRKRTDPVIQSDTLFYNRKEMAYLDKRFLKPHQRNIELTLTKVGDILNLELINKSDSIFRTTTIKNEYNRFVFITPDGTEIISKGWTNVQFLENVQVKLKPGESINWEYNLTYLLYIYELPKKGTYTVYWQVEDVLSAPFQYQYE